jgi:hypothetical protein
MSRRRRGAVAVLSLFLAPALMYVLERRAQRRNEPLPRWARPAEPRTPAPEPAPEPEPALPAESPVFAWAPPEPPPALDPGPAPFPDEPTDELPPIAGGAAMPAVEVLPAERRIRPVRLLIAIVAIVVLVPTAMYIALSPDALNGVHVSGSSLISFTSDDGGTPAAQEVPSLRVISYYPARAGWTYMWTRFDATTIDADFRKAHELGFDTVRIFVPPEAFGFPRPTPVMTERLAEVVARAHADGLRVGLSLFDRFERYDDLAGSQVWLQAVLGPYLNDDRVAFVELHNEIDPTNPAATSWDVAMTRVVRSEHLLSPVIASVSGKFGAPGLAKLARALRPSPPDVYSLHYYGNPAYLPGAIKQAQRAVKPHELIVGETGYATSATNAALQGTPNAPWAQEGMQSIVLRSAFAATRAAGLPAPGIWTLSDFVPSAFPPGIAPDDRTDEQKFGLLRVNGSFKPAAADVRRFLRGGAISTDINADFTQGGQTPSGPQPLYWRVFDAADGTLTWDNTVGHSALGSVKLSATQGTTARVPSYFQQIWSIQIHPRQTYSAIAWARGVNVQGDDRIALSWFTADGRYLGEQQSPPLVPGTADWQRLVVRGRPPKGAAALQVHLKSAHEPGTVWFDDVVVR